MIKYLYQNIISVYIYIIDIQFVFMWENIFYLYITKSRLTILLYVYVL